MVVRAESPQYVNNTLTVPEADDEGEGFDALDLYRVADREACLPAGEAAHVEDLAADLHAVGTKAVACTALAGRVALCLVAAGQRRAVLDVEVDFARSLIDGDVDHVAGMEVESPRDACADLDAATGVEGDVVAT